MSPLSECRIKEDHQQTQPVNHRPRNKTPDHIGSGRSVSGVIKQLCCILLTPGPGANLAGTCKHTLYIPLWNRSPCHRLHKTFSRGNAAHTSHNATPARQVMAIKTSPYHQCKDGIFPDSAPRSPSSVAQPGHVNHAQTTPPEHLSAKSTGHDRKDVSVN